MSRRLLVIVCLYSIAIIDVRAHAQQETPTRESIMAMSAEAKANRERLDLIAAFGTDFSGMDLSGVDFRGYHYVGFSTNLRHANFAGSDLRNAQFGSSILDGADFTGADLRGAYFVTASLREAIFANANLKGTGIRECDLTRAVLRNLDLSESDVSGSRFVEADMRGVVLVGATNDWYRIFTRSDLTGADLSGMNLVGAQFDGATLVGANLSGADLSLADFTGADLTDVDLTNAVVTSADFRSVRGLSDQDHRDLMRQAARWKHDLREALHNVARSLYLPGYVAVVVAIGVLMIPMWRSSRRSWPVPLSTGVNLVALFPSLVLLTMALSGAHPTVQFNAGSAEAMNWWSFWVSAWPIFMLLLLAAGALWGGAMLVFIGQAAAGQTPKRSKLAWLLVLLTAAHCVYGLHWVGSHFPSA